MRKDDGETTSETTATAAGKVYERPVLTEVGSLKELTTGGAGTVTDFTFQQVSVA